MKDINKELVDFLQSSSPEDDLNEIIHQIQAGGYRSLRLINFSRTKFNDSDFIFNNQQYKFVVTRKLPLFQSSDEYEEEDDLLDGIEESDGS